MQQLFFFVASLSFSPSYIHPSLALLLSAVDDHKSKNVLITRTLFARMDAISISETGRMAVNTSIPVTQIKYKSEKKGSCVGDDDGGGVITRQLMVGFDWLAN